MVSRPAERSLHAPLVAIAAATLLTSAITYAAPSDRPSAAPPNAAAFVVLGSPDAAPTLASGALPLAAAAPNADPGDRARLERTIRFLQDQQNIDGGFPGYTGGASDPGMSAWVALALAAGGVNPQDQRQEGGASAYDYITAHASELKSTTDFERVLLVAIAAGADPRNVGGIDLLQSIVERQLPDGSFPYAKSGKAGALNATAFGVIGLSVIDDPALRPVLERACDWLLETQEAAGSWVGNADLTASAIEALRSARRSDQDAEARAFAYLRREAFVAADGGFNQGDDEPESNSASTAWVVQGMWAAGLEPRTWTESGGPGPLDLLAALQDPATGMIRWKASLDANPVWMTAYAAPAFAGYPLPIPAVARAVKAEDAPTADGGVSSGGGGQGAPNFSRPEPQSQGETAGGVRRVDQAQRAKTSTKRRSGSRDERQRTTSASNGAGDAGVTRDVAAPAAANGPGELAEAAAAAAAAAAPGASSPGGVAAGRQVAGLVVNAARSGADGTADLATEAVAPGLISADQRRAGSLAAGIGSALVLCILMGMKIERDQLAERLP